MRSNELMREEIQAQSKLFTEYGESLYQNALDLIRSFQGREIHRVYITGCGDSYFAGVEFASLFESWAKVETYAVHAMEFSRYVCEEKVGEDCLVFSISASGKVSRTVEAAYRAKEKGAMSVAITSTLDSRLAKAANYSFEVNIPNHISLAPGIRSYAASQISLIYLALGLATIKETLTQEEIQKLLKEIHDVGYAIEETVKMNQPLVEKYLDENLGKVSIYHVLGSGPNYGTAQFAVMKFLESSGFPSLAVDTEEWAHSHYFVANESTHVVVMGAKGNSYFRSQEILSAPKAVGAKTILVCEEDDETQKNADYAFWIKGKDIPEWISPILYPIPIELLCLMMSERLGRKGLDFENKPWLKEENFKQIYSSECISLKGEPYE